MSLPPSIVGALIGLALVVMLYPAAARTADRAVIRQERHNTDQPANRTSGRR